MPEKAAKFTAVRIVSGPEWCQGKVGWRDDSSTGYTYFGPQDEEPTSATIFEGGAYLTSLMTVRPLTQKEKKTYAQPGSESPNRTAFGTL